MQRIPATDLKNQFRAGPTPSTQTNVVSHAPTAVRALAAELGFETDNLQIRMAFRGRVLFAHDYVHNSETGMDALHSFDSAQVIDGTDRAAPKHVAPDDPDICILKERVHKWKEMWTPHDVLKAGGIRNMTDLLNDSTSQGAVLNPCIPS